MGDFGGEHRDRKDNPAYTTHMIAMSDLPPDYDLDLIIGSLFLEAGNGK